MRRARSSPCSPNNKREGCSGSPAICVRPVTKRTKRFRESSAWRIHASRAWRRMAHGMPRRARTESGSHGSTSIPPGTMPSFIPVNTMFGASSMPASSHCINSTPSSVPSVASMDADIASPSSTKTCAAVSPSVNRVGTTSSSSAAEWNALADSRPANDASSATAPSTSRSAAIVCSTDFDFRIAVSNASRCSTVADTRLYKPLPKSMRSGRMSAPLETANSETLATGRTHPCRTNHDSISG